MMRDEYRHRRPYEPRKPSTTALRLAEAEFADLGVKAAYDTRVLLAEECIRRFAEEWKKGQEIDWLVTSQYDGRDSRYAGFESLVQWRLTDLIRCRLHRLGLATLWEAYDPAGSAATAKWASAFSDSERIPPRARPWGMIMFCDAGLPPGEKAWRSHT